MIRQSVSILFAIILLGMTPGCLTVTPDSVRSEQASYDEGGANSGILSVDDSGATVTPHFRVRYNAMIAKYGKLFTPPLAENLGVTPAADGKNYRITLQGLDYFITMNQWRKMAKEVK